MITDSPFPRPFHAAASGRANARPPYGPPPPTCEHPARRSANELLTGSPTQRVVHPNDHVNKGQSSNDTFPTVGAAHGSVRH